MAKNTHFLSLSPVLEQKNQVKSSTKFLEDLKERHKVQKSAQFRTQNEKMAKFQQKMES